MDAFVVRPSPPLPSWLVAKQPLSEIPNAANLERMEKEDLIKVIGTLKRERDKLAGGKTLGGSPKKAKTAAAPAAAAPDNKVVMKRIRDKAFKAVKKTGHNEKKKPYTEVSEGMPSKGAAFALLRGLPVKSDTARMTKWLLEGEAVSDWLGSDRLVHPVKFDGKSWCLRGQTPKVYAWAAFESVEVKYEASSSLLTLKFRTRQAGSGNPGSQPSLAAYSTRAVGRCPSRDEQMAVTTDRIMAEMKASRGL